MQKEQKPFTGYNSTMLPITRELRREMTKQERHLWYDFLRKHPIKIYKQRSIGRFVVDFYCSSARLVIEVDGGQHYTDDGLQYDAERTAFLDGYGLEVLRFTNLDVDKDFEGVCKCIDNKIKERMKSERV